MPYTTTYRPAGASKALLTDLLRGQGLDLAPESAIFPLHIPPDMHIRRAAYAFHEAGLFVNAIEWPAVPADRQRFRISLMSEHTQQDLEELASVTATIWSDRSLRASPPTFARARVRPPLKG